jgi:hypothetical protein
MSFYFHVFAMTSTELPESQLQDIRWQLAEAQQVFNAIEMHPRESLRDFEYRVKRHSDKILSLKVAEQVQQQLIEQGARDAEEQIKRMIH